MKTPVWQGGRLYLDEYGEEVFVPLGTKRIDCGVTTPLSFLGDALRDASNRSTREVIRLVAPVEGAV